MKKHSILFAILALTLFFVLVEITLKYADDTDFLAAIGSQNALGGLTLADPSVVCENALPKVALAWSLSTNAKTYSIQRSEGQNAMTFSGSIMSQLKNTSYIDQRWVSNYGRGYYSYRVIAYNGNAKKYSNIVTVRLPECAQSVPPVVTGTSSAASSTQPTPVPPKVSTTTNPTPVPVPVPVPTQAGKMPSWMKWGAYVGWQDSAMSDFESMVGKQPQMEMVFAHWGNDNFPSFDKARIADKGRTMVLFWEAVDYNRDYFSQPEYSFDSVLAGKQDAYFTKFAADAKAYGGEVILIPYSEFNGDWFPWGGTIGNNTPEKYIAAYRYIHNFFTNVPNVKFGWAPNSDAVPDTAANKFELFYPGDAYVDVVGVDGFSFKKDWMTFDQVFANSLTRLQVYNKPIYIFSMGAAEDARKPAWITDALTVQLAKYPRVVGWLWFNENKENNWLVNSSPAALTAFKDILQ